MQNRKLPVVLALMLVLGMFFSCRNESRYGAYLTKDLSQNKKLVRLFQLLEDQKSEEERFSIVEQIISQMRQSGSEDMLIMFLSDFVQEYPDDPYMAYYLLPMANYYLEREEIPVALYYLRRIINNTEDLIVEGKSLHLRVLKELIMHSNDPEELVYCYQDILKRFPEEVEPAVCYYYIAENSEAAGHWDEAMRYYSLFMQYPNTVIPDEPNAYYNVKRKILYYNEDITWAFDELDDLVSTLRWAVNTRRGYALENYKPPKELNTFFMMSWIQDDTDSYTHVPAEITSFVTPKTEFAGELESFSNDREAYLLSTGWANQWQLGVWYLYFRRIDLPERPEYHRKWEWGGIFLGERR